MAGQVTAQSDFAETFAIHVALRAAVKTNQYGKNEAVLKAANRLCKELQSERSVYGRQLKMIGLMEKGASVAGLGRKLRASRRTVFRYLNALEDAGVDIRLEDGKYKVGKNVGRMLRA